MGVRSKRTKSKTRRRTRDLDQIKADLASPEHLQRYRKGMRAEDLPGSGDWYCVECAKWFENNATLLIHERGKFHKRRVKKLQEDPYTQKEADAAIGLRTDNTGLYAKVTTQDGNDMETSE